MLAQKYCTRMHARECLHKNICTKPVLSYINKCINWASKNERDRVRRHSVLWRPPSMFMLTLPPGCTGLLWTQASLIKQFLFVWSLSVSSCPLDCHHHYVTRCIRWNPYKGNVFVLLSTAIFSCKKFQKCCLYSGNDERLIRTARPGKITAAR